MSRVRPPGPSLPPSRMPPPRMPAPGVPPRMPPRMPVSRMPGRPGLLRLLWKRRRGLMGPGLSLALLAAVGVAGFAALQPVSRTGNVRERLGDVTAQLGMRVQDVAIDGLNKTPEPLVRAALGVHRGDPILGFSLAEARARIETINWVESATVERRLPTTIVVHLTERRPFAVWQHEGRFVLIDRNGEVMTDPDVASFASQIPLVVGTGAPVAAAALIDTLARYPQIMSHLQAAVRVGERRWNLRMNNGADVLLPEGAETPALAKLMELQSTYALLDRPLQVVDLRLADRLVVRPQPEKTDPKEMGGKETGKPAEAGKTARKPT